MKQNLGDLAEDGVAFCFDTIFETLSEINESLVSARLAVPDGISWLFEESGKDYLLLSRDAFSIALSAHQIAHICILQSALDVRDSNGAVRVPELWRCV